MAENTRGYTVVYVHSDGGHREKNYPTAKYVGTDHTPSTGELRVADSDEVVLGLYPQGRWVRVIKND